MADNNVIGSAVFDLLIDDSKFSSGLKNAEGQAKKSGGVISGVFSNIGKAMGGLAVGGLAISGLQKLSGIFGGVSNAVIGVNSQLQQANIGFTTMLGSAQKAQAFLSDLQKFAASTPFEFPDLVKNSQLLLGMGINAKDIIPDLTALGDSVASVGGSSEVLNNTMLAFGQIAAKGTLSMDNMNQLLEGGVPTALKVLAAQYGVTTGKMVEMISAGDVQASDALPKLIQGLEMGTSATAALGGMMAKQSQTFQGAMSNISDATSMAIAVAFKPLFSTISSGAIVAAQFFGSKMFQSWANDLSSVVGGSIHAVIDVIGSLVNLLSGPFSAAWGVISSVVGTVAGVFQSTIIPVFSGVINLLQRIEGPIAVAVGAFAGLSAIGPIIGVVGAAISALGVIVGPVMAGIAGALALVLSPIGLVSIAVAALYTAWQHNFMGIQQVAAPVLAAIENGLHGLVQTWQTVTAAFASGGLSAAFSALESAVVPTLSRVGSQIVNTFDQITGGMFSAGFNLISTYVSGIVGGANSLLNTVLTSISQEIANFFIGNSPPPVGPLSQIDKGGQTLMETYGAGMQEGLSPAQQAAANVADIFAKLDATMSIPEARQALKDASGNLEAMKAEGAAVDDQLKAINDQSSDLADKTSDLQREIQDITDAYQAQIDPLQAQVDLLTKAKDYTQERRDDELQLQDIQLQQAELAAEGDPKKRAELAAQIALLQSKEKQKDLDKQIADTEGQIAAAPLKAQQDALDLQEQQAQFAQRQADIDAARAKASVSDQQAALKLQQQALALQQQQDKINQDRAAGKDVTGAQQKLDLAKQQYQLSLKSAAGGTDELAAKQAQLDLDKQQFDLKQQIAATDTSGDDVASLQLKLEELKKQKELNDLGDQGKLAQIAGQKTLLDAQEQQNQLAEQEKQTKGDIAAIPFQQQIDKLNAAQKAQLDPLNAQLKIYQRESDLLQEQAKKWQAVKSDIGDATSALQSQVDAAKKAAGDTSGGGAIEGVAGLATVDTPEIVTPDAVSRQSGQLTQVGSQVAQHMGDGMKDWFRGHLGSVIGLALGAVAFGPLGAVAGAALGTGIQRWFQSHGISADMVFGKLKDEAERLTPVLGFLKDNISGIVAVMFPAADVAVRFAQAVGKDGLGGALKDLPNIMLGVITDALNFAATIGGLLVDLFHAIPWDTVRGALLTGFTTALGFLGDLASTGIDFAGQFLSWAGDEISSVDWSGIASTVLGGIGSALSTAATAVKNATGWVVAWVSGVVGSVDWSGTATSIFSAVSSALMTAATTVASGATWLYDWVSSQITGTDWLGTARSIQDSLGGALTTAGGLFSGASASDGGTLASVLGTLEPILSRLNPLVNGFETALEPVWTNIRDSLNPTLAQMAPLWASLQALFVQVKPALEAIGIVMGALAVGALATLLGGLGGFVGLLTGALPGAIQTITGIIETFTGVIQLISTTVIGVAKIVNDIIHGDWSQAWTDAQQMVQGMSDAVSTIIGGLKDTITGIISGLTGGVLGLISGFKDSFIGFFQGIYDAIVGHSIVPDLVNGIIGWITTLQTTLAGIWQVIHDTAVNTWQAVHDGIDALTGGIEAVLGEPFIWLRDVFDWASIGTKVSDVWDGIKTTISDLKEDLKSALQWPFEQFRDNVGGIASAAGENFLKPLRDVMTSFGKFVGGVKDAVNWVGGKLKVGDLITGSWTIPQFAGGVKDFGGGYAIVGEQGPELVKLPGGSDVIPADQTKSALNASMLGQAESASLLYGKSRGWTGIGSGLTDFASSIKKKASDVAGDVLSTLADWVGKGAEWVTDAAFKATGVGLDLNAPFAAIGTTAYKETKGLVTKSIGDLLGSLKDALPASTGSGAQVAGNAILDKAYLTKGVYMWCEKFIGDVMESLGLRYTREPDAATHAKKQSLTSGTGPAGAVVFMPWDTFGHVAFSMGNGMLFGTANTASGTGVQAPLPGAAYTMHPYAKGGIIREPVLGQGLRTGELYSFAERGAERVTPMGGNSAREQIAQEIHVYLDLEGNRKVDDMMVRVVQRERPVS